jgi:hypothetical protein
MNPLAPIIENRPQSNGDVHINSQSFGLDKQVEKWHKFDLHQTEFILSA